MKLFLAECLLIVLFYCTLCDAILARLSYRDFWDFLSLTLKLAYIARGAETKKFN